MDYTSIQGVLHQGPHCGRVQALDAQIRIADPGRGLSGSRSHIPPGHLNSRLGYAKGSNPLRLASAALSTRSPVLQVRRWMAKSGRRWDGCSTWVHPSQAPFDGSYRHRAGPRRPWQYEGRSDMRRSCTEAQACLSDGEQSFASSSSGLGAIWKCCRPCRGRA